MGAKPFMAITYYILGRYFSTEIYKKGVVEFFIQEFNLKSEIDLEKNAIEMWLNVFYGAKEHYEEIKKRLKPSPIIPVFEYQQSNKDIN
jgi:hypothetical protein